jgi:hypothetical protein
VPVKPKKATGGAIVIEIVRKATVVEVTDLSYKG